MAATTKLALLHQLRGHGRWNAAYWRAQPNWAFRGVWGKVDLYEEIEGWGKGRWLAVVRENARPNQPRRQIGKVWWTLRELGGHPPLSLWTPLNWTPQQKGALTRWLRSWRRSGLPG